MLSFRGRPFVQCHFSRQLRKIASYKKRNNQFTVGDFDQFMAKCRTAAGVNAMIDFIEECGDFTAEDPAGWFNQNWRGIRNKIDSLPDVDLEAPPELYYSAAPDGRGRRARRAMPPAYETDSEFQRDKELFEAELRGDVGPLNEGPNEEESS